MKILITGASGFVGSFLLKQLLMKDKHEIAAIIREPEKAWRIQNFINDIHVIKGSIDVLESYRKQFLDFKPDIIIHLAWAGVDGQSRNKIEQWRNVCYTIELMELGISSGSQSFIGLGSQAEYGDANAVVDELRIAKPTTLYGVAKLAACNISQAVANSAEMRFVWLRLFSSYGPKDQPTWLIPYIINTMLKGESPNLTAAEQIWDYIHVEDVAAAIFSVTENFNANGIFNLGSGNGVPLKLIIEKTRDLIDPSIALNLGVIPYRKDQVMHLQANIDRLTNATGWKPKIDINAGLLETVNWWKAQK